MSEMSRFDRMRARTASGLRRAAAGIEGRGPSISGRSAWIMGSPRTGSTWLMAMLSEHPRIAGIDEPLIGAHLGVLHATLMPDFALPPPAARSADPSPTLASAHAERWTYFFAREHADAWRGPLADLLERRLGSYAARTGLPADGWLIVKEPNGSEGAAVLFDALPSARLLNLVRDPRDTLDSLLDVAEGGWNETIEVRGSLDAAARRQVIASGARLWRARMAAVLEAWERLPEAQKLLVRYEDLRSDPAPNVQRILGWLGLELDEGRVAQIVERHAFESIPAGKRGKGQFARAAQPGLWQERFSADEQALIDELLGPELRALGYAAGPAAGQTPPAPSRSG